MRPALFVLAIASACSSESPSAPANEVFEAFWSTIDREYAVFDVRLTTTTWAEVGETNRARIVDGMSDEELYEVLLDTAKALDDGHTVLTADSLGRQDDAEVSVYPNYDAVGTIEDIVVEHYLDQDAFTTGAEDEISWGTITATGGKVGYISITAMEGLATTDDEAADIAAAKGAMQCASADMKAANVRGVIVDIRANEGGFDTVSLEIAHWFAGARTVAWSEQVRNGRAHDALAAPVPTYVEAMPTGGIAVPVVVLTSGGTYSAAETFLLAMRVRDHVSVLGERSSGHLSDEIAGTLPNGWTFTYSGERYIAADGQLYEVQGIPVDTPMSLDVTMLAAGKDTMLEAALAALR